jgi:hypothetical protein
MPQESTAPDAVVAPDATAAPDATPIAPVTAPHVPMPKVSKAKEPDPYDGSPEQLDTFWAQVNMYLSAYPTSFASEYDRVHFTLGHMTGGEEARRWQHSYIKQHVTRGTLILPDYDTFWGEVRKQFGDTTKKQLAHTKLAVFKQGSLSVKAFISKFERLTEDAQYLVYDADAKRFKPEYDRVLINLGNTAVKPSILKGIYSESNPPTTYAAWKEKVMQLGIAEEMIDIMPGKSFAQDTTVKSFTSAKSSPPAKQSSSATSSFTTQRDGTGTVFGGAGEPMDLDEMRRKGLCFRCQKRGHLSRNCPEKRKFSKTQVRGLFDELTVEDKKELLESLKEGF